MVHTGFQVNHRFESLIILIRPLVTQPSFGALGGYPLFRHLHKIKTCILKDLDILVKIGSKNNQKYDMVSVVLRRCLKRRVAPSDEFELKFPEPRRAWAFQFSSGNRAVHIYADK